MSGFYGTSAQEKVGNFQVTLTGQSHTWQFPKVDCTGGMRTPAASIDNVHRLFLEVDSLLPEALSVFVHLGIRICRVKKLNHGTR